MKSAETNVVDPVIRTSPLPEAGPWRTPDPFLFCVHHLDNYPASNGRFGPAVPLRGRNLGQDFEGIDGWNMYHGQSVPGFPQHPHRGFETVTVVRTGLLDHADSLGAAARYGGGDVQWLTAGNGVLHSEMFPLLKSDAPNPLELFQIWLNLPRANKRVTPHFTMLWADTIPRHVAHDGEGRPTEVAVIAGRLGEHRPPAPPPNSWAAQENSEVAIWTVRMAAGAEWTLPPAVAGLNRFLYFFKGRTLKVGGRHVTASTMIELRSEAPAKLEAGDEEVELLMLQGRPLNEPVVQYGPFVMNTREEIQQAFADYQRTRFGGWPWENDDPVHGATPERFARHADGKVEKPA